ncbi:hypothetical protein [Streptomyces jumonjinensis]|uniref:hypothetical protein n=1 Tax=Streptomyces jumonjinensis TaxID=1945 RepID=UPI001E341749|nr:hypothetical protein [Streptomyces jumonjinensis]
MVSHAKNERCVALAKALVPLLERSGPEGAGGYGGTLQVHVPSETAEQLGGLDLIRAALRKAARELGWKFGTYGFGGSQERAVALIGIHDRREIPEPYAQVVEEHRQRQMRAAVERVSARYSALDVRRRQVRRCAGRRWCRRRSSWRSSPTTAC